MTLSTYSRFVLDRAGDQDMSDELLADEIGLKPGDTINTVEVALNPQEAAVMKRALDFWLANGWPDTRSVPEVEAALRRKFGL